MLYKDCYNFYRLAIFFSTACFIHFLNRNLLGGPRRNIAMTFGMEKLEWFGYPTVKMCLFVETEFTNVTDRQIDTT